MPKPFRSFDMTGSPMPLLFHRLEHNEWNPLAEPAVSGSDSYLELPSTQQRRKTRERIEFMRELERRVA